MFRKERLGAGLPANAVRLPGPMSLEMFRSLSSVDEGRFAAPAPSALDATAVPWAGLVVVVVVLGSALVTILVTSVALYQWWK